VRPGVARATVAALLLVACTSRTSPPPASPGILSRLDGGCFLVQTYETVFGDHLRRKESTTGCTTPKGKGSARLRDQPPDLIVVGARSVNPP
jgi:hypothetical protein